MKHVLFAAIAAALLLNSCTKDESLPTPIDLDGEHSYVTLSLCAAEDADTRAFYDASAKAEAWESALSSLTVFAFDGDNLLVRRDFTSAELTAKTATFALPKSAAGKSCAFYAVANYDTSSVKTKAALTALVESSAAQYNGTFSEVSTKAKRAGGFAMSGTTTKTVGAVNTSTSVAITLRRTVAKVALQVSIDPAFSDKYSGTLTVNSVKLSRAASQTLLMAGAAASSGAMTYTHTQTPASASGKYNALFYLFENGTLAAGSRVLLEIVATYDLDGNAATTDDRSEVTYAVELSGKAAGEIVRNGYYRVGVNITGLVGQECQVAITVAEWESPVTQNVEIGA